MKVRQIVQIEIDIPDLPKKIADARILSGMSVKAVCADAGISRTYWNRIIGGKEAYIALTTLQKIEKTLNTNFAVNRLNN